MSLLDTALSYAAAGLTVLPDDPKAKYPVDVMDWQTIAPDEAMIRQWWKRWPRRGIGVRDQEGLDFDNKGHPSAADLYTDWHELVESLCPGLPARLLMEQTPSGGYHLVWRCEVIAGNQKLAERPPTDAERRADPKVRAVTLIETRGKGGQFQVAPTPGYQIVRGDWRSLPIIAPAERQIVLDCARALHRLAGVAEGERSEQTSRPGDQYNEDHADDALRLLEAEGWRTVYRRGDALYLCRPGKKQGVSATFGFVAPGVLYVFSASASPFDVNRAYSPFAVYTMLRHNGDYKAAARALAAPREAKAAQSTNNGIKPTEYVADWTKSGTTAAELQRMSFPPRIWVVDSILSIGATVLGGKSKSKKSWLALNCAVAVAYGGKAMGQLDVTPGRVLYLDMESNQQRMQERLQAIIGNQQWPENLHIYTEWKRGPDGIALIDGFCLAHPDRRLIIVDILQNIRPQRVKGANPYDEDYEAVKALNQCAERNNVAMLILHHTRKAKAEDVFDELSGTMGLTGGVAGMWVLSAVPGEKDASTLSIRGRDIINDDPIALVWDAYLCQHTVAGTAAQYAISHERRALLEVMEDDQEHTAKDLAELTHKSVNAVTKILVSLSSINAVEKIGHGKYVIVRQNRQNRQNRNIGQSRQSEKNDSAMSSLTLPILPSAHGDMAESIQGNELPNNTLSKGDSAYSAIDSIEPPPSNSGVPKNYEPSSASESMIERLRRPKDSGDTNLT